MKTYQSEVLVIGGGGAATAATISAHRAGARTLMAVKGRFGVAGARGAGATSNPLADFWTIRTVGPKGGWFNPPDLVYKDMLQTGLGMADPKLCRIFVEEVAEAIQRLREMGMQFQSKMLATMPAAKAAGHTNNIVAIQKAVIDSTHTELVDHANITDLIIENHRCVGAVGVHDNGDPFVMYAGAVILATGGVGQLFEHSFNPSGNTGDGYAMALRAGAELFNMEFMQQGLATTWPTQAMVMLYEMPEPYRMYNRFGKSFIQGYLPDNISVEEVSRLKAMHWPVSARDQSIHLDRAIHGEALAHRTTEHNGVFLDLSRARRGFQPEMFVEYMAAQGINIAHDLLQIQIHHHTSNGGVRVDADGQSCIPGLFAVGETMGYQGADRLGGTMLGGSQVFGWRAGKKAAELGRGVGGASLERADRAKLDMLLTEPLARHRDLHGSQRPSELLPELKRVMWRNLLVSKSAQSLGVARAYVSESRDRLARDIFIAEPMDHALAWEHKNLLDTAEAIIEAAYLRTESRGSHVRSDYPLRDDTQWLTNIFLKREGRALKLRRNRVWGDEPWIDDPNDIRIKPWG